jgi:hypothetical protein
MNAIKTTIAAFNSVEFLESLFAGKINLDNVQGLDENPKMCELLTFLTTIAVVVKDGFVDDHSGRKVEDHPSYLVLAKGEGLYLCPTYGDGGFCLNPIELEGGVAHLSRYSVGGVVYSDQQTYEAYNDSRDNRPSDHILACAQKRSVGYAVKVV